MIDPDLRSSPLSTARDLFRHARAGSARSATLFIAIYLGVVVGFGAVMAELVRAAGG